MFTVLKEKNRKEWYYAKFTVILEENVNALLDGQDGVRKLHRHDVTPSRVHSIVDENSEKQRLFVI